MVEGVQQGPGLVGTFFTGRDRASVGGLRYYSYGFVYLSMSNLLQIRSEGGGG